MAVKETSYYGTLEGFLNGIGSELRPQVRAIINTKSIGAGIPDGGLFSKEQFSKTQEQLEDFVATPPSRGVIEVKGTSENIEELAKSSQVKKYLDKYRQVLITNYYQFLLLSINKNGEIQYLEKYNLAENETDFWAKCDNPKEINKEHGEEITRYLMRVMLHAAPLNEPKDVAWFLASYASDARTRIEKIDLPALEDVKLALEESIGVSFSDKKGEHFFRSTLIQTIFYGIFSSWVLYNKDKESKSNSYDWKLAAWYLKVPMIKGLFDRIANPSQLGRLGIIELLDYTAAVLNRIEKDSFFEKFEETEAVLYFYEPFLEAFDPELRKEMGVWYTPKEVIHYMVEKVDTALKNELNIKRGLADENVYVLDPACGTGAYLVEVLKRIDKTLKEEGADALTGEDLKEAAMKRIFGFEILPAPYVVSHLQIGILLQNLGASVLQDDDRVGVYLTNALSGWEPPKEKGKQIVAFPEMQYEKDAAEHIKREKPILVILGNPPYNAFAGISPKEEGDLVTPYKEGLISKWKIKKFNLDELYVRFLRIAEKSILKQGKGIICYVSSFTYTHKESFVVMRERFFKNFNSIYIDSLNGDSRETGKKTPDGKPDPSVFSTKYNRAGIKVGAAIGLFIKNGEQKKNADVYYRDFWGADKTKILLENIKKITVPYEKKSPSDESLFSFRYDVQPTDYNNWISVDKLAKVLPFQGLDEDRKFDLISLDSNLLSTKIQKYYNKENSIEDLINDLPGLTSDSSSFNAKIARKKILEEDTFKSDNIKSYYLRAFDKRYCYHSIINPLWKRSRPELKAQFFESNSFLICRKSTTADKEGVPFYFSKSLFARDSIKGHATAIPFKIKLDTSKHKTLSVFDETIDNISELASTYLSVLKENDASKIWFNVLALGFTENYLKENEESIKRSYPKIPFPNDSTQLNISATLGKKLASLLDTEEEVEGISTNPTDLFKTLAILSKSSLLDDQKLNLSLNANWGNQTISGIMPGTGKYVERAFTLEEYNIYEQSGYDKDQIHYLLGDSTYDVFLNDEVYWKNIPSNVWKYQIGGYQVIKKWLSYRESSIINRPLKKEEVREITNISRRLSAILLMGSSLNENYNTIKGNSYKWA